MIGWLRRLFGPRKRLTLGLPPPDDQRRELAERLTNADAALLSDEDAAALKLASHGREQWQAPSRADALREERGYPIPPRARGGEVSAETLTVMNEARKQLDELEVSKNKELSQLRNELDREKQHHKSTDAVLGSYIKGAEAIRVALSKACVPTIARGKGVFNVLTPVQRIEWLATRLRAKRRKKTTPRRRA